MWLCKREETETNSAFVEVNLSTSRLASPEFKFPLFLEVKTQSFISGRAVNLWLSHDSIQNRFLGSRFTIFFDSFLYFTLLYRCNLCKSYASCQAVSYPGRVHGKIQSISKCLISKTAEAVVFLFLHPPYFRQQQTANHDTPLCSLLA